MGNKYTCKFCHNKIDSDYAFQTYNKSGTSYWCSQSEYVKYTLEENKRKAVKSYACRILGKEVSHGQLTKELDAWHETNSWDKLIAYFEANADSLENKMNSKDFTSTYGKIRYLSTIVKNQIDDFKLEVEEPVRPASEFVEPVINNNKKKRRGLVDVDV